MGNHTGKTLAYIFRATATATAGYNSPKMIWVFVAYPFKMPGEKPLRVNQAMGSTYYNRKTIAVPHHTHSLDYADRDYNTVLAPIIVLSNCHLDFALSPLPFRTYSRDNFKMHACG